MQRNVYCNEMPAPIQTFTDRVEIHFRTDHSQVATGFRLEYAVIGCGDVLRSPSGVLLSPKYPANYPANTECRWDIEVPFGNLIELTLNDYDFHASPNCTAGGLVVSNQRNVSLAEQIAAGSNTTMLELQRFCGQRSGAQQPDVITSHANRLFIWFHSGGEYSGRGFNATYRQRPISEYSDAVVVDSSVNDLVDFHYRMRRQFRGT